MRPFKSYTENALFLQESSSLHPVIDWTNREYCKFHDPCIMGSFVRPWPYGKNAIFLLLFLSTLRHGSDKLSIYTVVMITKEGSTIIVNFTTHESGVLMLGHNHTSHYSEYALPSTLSLYSTLFVILLRDCIAGFL